jgi:hypothetical protein
MASYVQHLHHFGNTTAYTVQQQQQVIGRIATTTACMVPCHQQQLTSERCLLPKFAITVLSQVEAAVDGYCCTVFAFGQTGSGKTYTIIGPSMAGFQEAAWSAAGSSRATPVPQTPVTPSSAAAQRAGANAAGAQLGSEGRNGSDYGSRPDSSSTGAAPAGLAGTAAAAALHDDEGLLARCVAHLYSSIDARQQEFSWRVQASCCEIYNETVTDLFACDKSQQLQVSSMVGRRAAEPGSTVDRLCAW